ncbi:MAG: hypothetical protein GXX88_17310 [Candidatus Hydrogenedentes bacterium]|nr:hypothetical protein [Candidatus Hydrogenedentota bacterium]
MDIITPIGGAGTSQTQMRVQEQAAVTARQDAVAEGISEAAIKLVQSAMANPDVGNSINMTV